MVYLINVPWYGLGGVFVSVIVGTILWSLYRYLQRTVLQYYELRDIYAKSKMIDMLGKEKIDPKYVNDKCQEFLSPVFTEKERKELKQKHKSEMGSYVQLMNEADIKILGGKK